VVRPAHAVPIAIPVAIVVGYGIIVGSRASKSTSGASGGAGDGLGGAGGGQCCGANSRNERSPIKLSTAPPVLAVDLMSSGAAAASAALISDIATFKSARKLKRNMCAQGIQDVPKEGCYHTHHIVARAHPAAERARQILRDVGIDIDNGLNGVYLDCDYHRKLHNDPRYYERVENLLNAAPKSQAGVAAALAVIRASLIARAF
jgi:A nuclease family of the HNH/ENDO VII superfamily with conserved AHH